MSTTNIGPERFLTGPSFDWTIRAVRRLDAARAQKEVTDSTRVIKQQELHKSLRVRLNFSIVRIKTTNKPVNFTTRLTFPFDFSPEPQQLLQSDW